ncbi:hypothetical protein H5410_052128 [Solanum commersonii]|uniref:Uncharacterized protein n=1 Tax=Solanum commersonii TaxID=4109 RepID=A0A9J5X241_SOLCO|nr:hypothetical protein H5410_052128 [Solanum commersonii]
MDYCTTLTLSKLPPVTKVDTDVSSIPPIILLSLGTYTDVLLDVRVENTTPKKGDIANEGKMSDVTLSKLQIQRKITHMHLVNLDRSKWLPENWRFGIKVHTTGTTT